MNIKLTVGIFFAFLLIVIQLPASAQQSGIVVNLAPVDGLSLTPDNIFNYRIESALPNAVNTKVKGMVRFRNSPLFFNYEFLLTIFPGSNSINPHLAHPVWSFSSSALRELFLNYQKLPQGTYEYCVSVIPASAGSETPVDAALSECLYQQSDDIFLINLIDPDNNAKIREFNPVLSWVVNYPFASELTYRLRIAEIKDGQNTVSAITRNNPIYKEGNLRQTSQSYPVYARSLELWQPYAWTVDAYYKDILLGGAEPWRFTIVEDSLLAILPKASVYVDIKRETNNAIYYAVGEVLIQYQLDEKMKETLKMEITDRNGKQIKSKEAEVRLGDNRIVFQLKGEVNVKHLKSYILTITNRAGNKFVLAFKYVNPDFL